MDGDEDAKIEIQDRAKPGAKKRNLNLNRQTLQVPNVKKARTASGSYVQPQYPQHSELDQLDYLLGVPSGTASVIDVRAATDSNILEEIVAATTPGQDQEPQNAHRVKEGTTVKGDETIVSHSQGEERCHNLLISRYEDGNSNSNIETIQYLLLFRGIQVFS